jgi:hypothetical protein
LRYTINFPAEVEVYTLFLSRGGVMLKICTVVGLLAVAVAADAAELSCDYNNIIFASGAVSCQENKEFKCSNGQWVPANKPCTPLITPAKPLKPVEKGSSVKVNEKTKKTEIKKLKCLSFSPSANNKVVIKNSCAVCQVATVVWDQKTEFSKYNVKPKSKLTIPAEGKVGNLIAEEACSK